MKTFSLRLARMLTAIVVTSGTVAIVRHLPGANRSIASMVLVLEVLATSTVGDRMLAIVTSISAALGFSYFFVDDVGSFAIETAEGAFTFGMMTLTALTGSHLAIRAQERAAEAIRRKEEMERLHQLGTALLVSSSVAEASQDIVENLVRLFGLKAAQLMIQGQPAPFVEGEASGVAGSEIEAEDGRYRLQLFGKPPSAEVRIALKNLIELVLDRARSAQQQARVEATERGEEFRRTVLNSLAHNFKTPLTSIKAAASILRGKRAMPTENAKELAAVIDEEADRLDRMIRESLDLARIEAHQASPRLEACSMGAIVETVAERVARYLGGRKLRLEIGDTLPKVFGDRFLLEQMIIQVVDNAWKYSKSGAEIRIQVSQAGGSLFVEIFNEGLPIPVEERDRIFSKFYRGRRTSSQVEGTGMGLPIARSIAEAHAGTLTLAVQPGGQAFCFTLPVGVGGETDDREAHHLSS